MAAAKVSDPYEMELRRLISIEIGLQSEVPKFMSLLRRQLTAAKEG